MELLPSRLSGRGHASRGGSSPPFIMQKGLSMSIWGGKNKAHDALAQAEAMSKSQAVIEFNMDGTIITANQNFLDAMGYRLPEIVGQHHQMFMPRAMRDSA